MKTVKKPINAVSMMRQIRDRLSAEVEGMSFDEEKRFIRNKVSKSRGPRSAGGPAKALQPAKHSLKETAYLLQSPANAKRLMKAKETLEKGRR